MVPDIIIQYPELPKNWLVLLLIFTPILPSAIKIENPSELDEFFLYTNPFVDVLLVLTSTQ
jgi:hypothetical protein